MSYRFKKNYARRSNYGDQRKLSDIQYIVYHYTGNDGDSDEGNSNYFANNHVGASAHYFVDSDSVTKSVKQSFVAWHCGHDVGGRYYHPECRNWNSIGIEMCDDRKDGKIDISKKTEENAVALGKVIAKKRGISQSHVVRHYDVTHKHCPAYMCGTKANHKRWVEFRGAIYGGLCIGRKYKTTIDLKKRVACGSSTYNGKLKKGTEVKVSDAKYSITGKLYIKVENFWLLAQTGTKEYVK